MRFIYGYECKIINILSFYSINKNYSLLYIFRNDWYWMLHSCRTSFDYNVNVCRLNCLLCVILNHHNVYTWTLNAVWRSVFPKILNTSVDSILPQFPGEAAACRPKSHLWIRLIHVSHIYGPNAIENYNPWFT